MYIQGVGHEEYLLYSNIYTLTLWKCIILGIILQIIRDGGRGRGRGISLLGFV